MLVGHEFQQGNEVKKKKKTNKFIEKESNL